MKQFILFIRKEFWHVFRDPKTMLMLFGMPIAQIALFGFALSNEVRDISLGIVDAAQNDSSMELIRRFEANASFEKAINYPNTDAVERAFKRGEIKVALIIPAEFKAVTNQPKGRQLQIIADASDPNTATTLIQYAEAIITKWQMEGLPNGMAPPGLRVETRMIYNPELKGATNFVPGVMALVLFLVGVLMTSVSIVREKENGTMEVLLVSPFNPILVIFAKAVPYFFLSLLNLTVILILSMSLMDLHIAGSIALLYFASSIFILTALSLGLLISNATKSQQTAMLISLMAMLIPTIMLTGFMFPLENMPKFLQVVSHLVPSRWYYQIAQAIMIKGQGWAFIWKDLAILSGMTLVFLSLSIRKFNIRLA